ncbi:MAG: acyl-CoA dehydratase activase [Candidatus Brocadiales bacterium]
MIVSLQNGEQKFIGVDIGSVSVKAIVVNNRQEVLEEHYVRSHGQPIEVTLNVLKDIASRTPLDDIDGIAVTGSGGKLLSEILGAFFVNEVVAQSRATITLYPHVRTIIEIGGEDSKLMLLEYDEATKQTRVADFAMNTMCAAGTGSFLDQQASRLGISIETEFGELSLKSKNPPRIAGRCSVFAKTDMIHLQQEGTPDYDIVAGLCYAMARNYKSNIGKGKTFIKPISFQGGVAANKGMIKAFEDVLELEPGELIIPKNFTTMGAIGAALTLMEKGGKFPFKGFKEIEAYLKDRKTEYSGLERLKADNYVVIDKCISVNGSEKVEVYLGVDVGSISTNVVIIDKDKKVLARRYLMTAGRPLEAVKRGLLEVGLEVGDKVTVCGVGTTGSGRYLTGSFIGADIVKNEITAHATAAAAYDKNVDTIFEIGGQDSKYVRLENGAITDFTMNKVCAAGTGSFLEEQAEKLDINIKEEFGQKAFDSCCPSHLGERCTVFMESDLNHNKQKGVAKDDLIAGLSYSIVLNYINRVVEDRSIGNTIFFQGGVAANRGVKAAFEKITGKKIIVPPHHDIMGAIGCAIIAMDERNWEKSRFKGFDLRERKYELSSLVCKDCSNICEIRKVTFSKEAPLHYGSRCGKFDDERDFKKGKGLPRLFRERKEALFNSYPKNNPDNPIGKKIGIPQIGTFYEIFPTWKAFFTELGLEVVTSRDTNSEIVRNGSEHVAAEPCFPIKVAHGHVVDMLDKDIDYLFLPSVVNMTHASPRLSHSYTCPYVQGLPYLIRSGVNLDNRKFEVLEPSIHLEWGEEYFKKTLRQIAKKLGITGKRVENAIQMALESQAKFYQTLQNRGKEILDGLKDDDLAIVIVSRPYNGCDTGQNLNLPEKLRDLGTVTLPLDFLPLDLEDISHSYPNMYWKYGQKILAAGRIIARDKRLYALYITNFGCGPDSFILKYFNDELKGKPYLTIEIDEHSADVGAVTRCEAFLDSLKNVKHRRVAKEKQKAVEVRDAEGHKKRKIYIPYMDDHGFMAAAAMRANGVDAESLPMSDQASLDFGRNHTSGKECYPCILTTGDIVKKTKEKDFDRDGSAFFMASAMGPCRFGQYNTFHRMILDELGLHDVPVITLDQEAGFDEDTKKLGTSFRKLTWNGILLVDYLQKLLRETRPYEVNHGEADAQYKLYLKRGEEKVEKNGDVLNVAEEAKEAFSHIKVDRTKPRPLIGVIGEVYVRSHAFSNNFIIRKIEKLGGEVVVPPFEEWINYIAYSRKWDCIRERNLKGLLFELISDVVQKYDARRISKPFKGAIRNFYRELPSKEVIKRGKRYLDSSMKGEAILSMGRAVEYAEKEFDGIINLIPFNCMPGTIVNALLERFQKEHDNIPCLKVSLDGQGQTNEETRLEAFMYQTHQRMQSKAKNGGNGENHNGSRLKRINEMFTRIKDLITS